MYRLRFLGSICSSACLSRLWLWLHGSEDVVQSVVVLGQRIAQKPEPLVDLGNRRRRQTAGTLRAFDAANDQARAFEHFEMPADGGLRHVKGPGELQNGRLAPGEPGQQGSPCGIGQRGKGGIQISHEFDSRYITIFLYKRMSIVKCVLPSLTVS